ncbi:MAG TPA: hypothetical protein VFA66_07410 [Gaiellaceae bacterium]|nr:hypothetical protein [Gaiellaceae bacterium]
MSETTMIEGVQHRDGAETEPHRSTPDASAAHRLKSGRGALILALLLLVQFLDFLDVSIVNEKGLLVYFGVDAIDDAIERVRELGGQASDMQEIPGVGLYAHCADPEGNRFGLFQGGSDS